MKNNYFIIHGSFGNPFVNWIPWLRRELEKENLEVYTPDFPTGVGYQDYNNWSKLLKTYADSGLLKRSACRVPARQLRVCLSERVSAGRSDRA